MDFQSTKLGKLSTEDIVSRLQECEDLSYQLLERLAAHARMQEYTEQLFNELVNVARDGIMFVNEVELGERFSADWIARRDEIVAVVQSYIDKSPITD